VFLSDGPAEAWPPRDPDEAKYDEDHDHNLVLPESPWTYENGSLNPSLRANRGEARQRRNASRRGEVVSVPPYNPDFVEGDDAERDNGPYNSSSDEDRYETHALPRVRRGSEGLEVRPVDRNEMLRRYVADLGEEEGRYQRYVPEPASDASESEDDHVPLAQLHPCAVPA
jgi:hypothetical protein